MNSFDNNNGSGRPVGYGRPPVATQFKPGQSGNPRGRPRGAKSRRAIVIRILMARHKVDAYGDGRRRSYTVLELVLIQLEKLAATGHHRAYRLITALEARYPRAEPSKPVYYIILPQRLTMEEFRALYDENGVPLPSNRATGG